MRDESMKTNDTFLIQLIDNQNLSWQGTIIWTKTGKKENFRSELELLRLIDSAYHKKPIN